jgi:Transposase domain (DUF772)
MVLQALEGVSDREAAQQLACNIAWKVACGLALTDQGFHPTVLALWRARLRASGRPERIFEAVRIVIAQTGVLKGRHRRALDSTLLDDAVATQDTVTQLVAAIRRVRRLVPAAGTLTLAAHDYDQDPGKPACAWDDPEARGQLVSALVSDALAALAVVKTVTWTPPRRRRSGCSGWGPARTWNRARSRGVRASRQGGGRSAHLDRGPGGAAHAQEPQQLPRRLQGTPGGRGRDRAGCAAALTPATAVDGPTGVGLLAAEAPGLQVLGDAAYGSGETRAAGHAQLIKPIPLAAAVPGGFTRDDCTIDLQASTVTCPAGHTVAITPAAGRCSTGAVAPARCRSAAPGQGRQDPHPAAPRP